MKYTVGIPLVLSIVAFALALVALLAGKDPGGMEDYHIIAFNTSTLGHDFLLNRSGDSSSTTTTAAPTATADSGGIGGFFSNLEASATAVIGSVESQAASILNDIGNDIVDKLSDELGIEQFYSLHVTDTCQGNFAPNATAGEAWFNVTNCTAPMDFAAMNISAIIEKELSFGPFDITLSDLGVSADMQNKLNDLPQLLEALAAIYIVSVVLSGLAMIGSAVGLFLVPSTGRKIIIMNFVLALLAMLFLLAGSLATTVGGSEVQKAIREKGGDDIGLVMNLGKKFEAVSWAAFALMLLAMSYWVYEFVVATRDRRRGAGAYGRRRGQQEKNSMDSHQSGGQPLKG